MQQLDNEIPNLKRTKYRIEGTVNLQSWKNFQNRQNSYGAKNDLEKFDGTVKLDFGGDMVDDNPQITIQHKNAYAFLIQHQEKIKDAILKTLLLKYKELQELYGYELEDAVQIMPDITNTNQFEQLIGLSTVHILNISKSDVAYVGYQFGCSWDDEHGLGIMTHKDRVVEIGGADTSFLTWVAEKDAENKNNDSNTIHLKKNVEAITPMQNEIQTSKKPWWKLW